MSNHDVFKYTHEYTKSELLNGLLSLFNGYIHWNDGYITN